ncbi:MAG: bifunctional UDP-N-acetylmuramoyl-tripeptide:D-alanyl-D-alanine ligase/alanine racemase [Prevotellaceae bacterium]|nr:bifunctional UDP-N-acetylmuramoyl-tripeptide:D-alanyl-D-alanine ligase/alanine racemase [Prevotellaceae bacterium]
MSYSIEKITTLIGAHRIGHHDSLIQFLLTDSRSLCFPEETLFFAIKTNKGDGAKYIPYLVERGVRNFVVSPSYNIPESADSDVNYLVVPSPLKALQRLAERHRDEFTIPVVGIAGSNGKTIVKEWLYQLLSVDKVATRSPRSWNSQIGVPLSVWLLDEHSQIGLFEAGISQPGEMEALRDIIQPTIGVFTYLGDAHQENFPSLQLKCTEKMTLFKDAEKVICCADDLVVRRSLAATHLNGELISWSKTDSNARFYASSIEKGESATIIKYEYKQPVGVGEGEELSFCTVTGTYEIPYISDSSIDNSITCAVTALTMGLTPTDLAARMPLLEPVGMRLEVKEGRRGLTLINDSYNSDINSLTIALDFMHRRPDHKGRRRVLVLSDLLQSGIPKERLYSDVNELVKANGVEKLIGIGDDICDMASLFEIEDKVFFHTVAAFIVSPAFAQLQDEVILLKGARRFGFEQIQELLVEKVHETTLEVNLSSVVANLGYYRSFMKPETKLVCMIKADGYGAGAVEIAKTLQDHRVDYLAVAVADEGVALRRSGITQNIIIMNPEMSSFKTLFDYDLEPEVYSFRLLDALVKAARREGVKGFPCHIKLDTGMCRLGFHPEEDMDALIEYLKGQDEVIPRSVFSHFVGSDSDDFDAFSAEQYALYDKGSRRLVEAFPHKILRHMCNSAGIEHFPERQMDMCRLGLGLYGVNPRDNSIINNVSTLKTTILQLRNVPAGHSVGYSRRTMLDRDSVIAAIPIGYADGLNRKLGNRNCYCLVNGQKAEYVGNICMDVCMIDVTDIDCHEGDVVEIFGDNLPVTVLSDKLGTIPYEVLTGISNRVKRVYFEE